MDPERPIEKLLRDYAKERRAQAGSPELHPATRRLLQGEVTRQYPRAQPKPAARRWQPFWVWALGTTAVMMLGFFTLMPMMFKAKTKSMSAKRIESGSELAMGMDRASKSRDAERQRELAAVSTATPVPSAAPAAESTKSVGNTASSDNAPAGSLDLQAGRELALADKRAETFSESLQRSRAQPVKELEDSARRLDEASKLKRESGSLAGTGGGSPARAGDLLADAKVVAGVTFKGGNKDNVAVPPASLAPAAPAEPVSLFAGNRSAGNVTEEKAPALALKSTGESALDGPTLAKKQEVPGGAPNVFFRNEAQMVNNARYSQVPARPMPTAKAARAAKGALAVNVVLNNFQMEQNGQELRVLDEDGSVYTGAVQMPPALSEQSAAAPAVAGAVGGAQQSYGLPAGAKDALAQTYGYNFAVTGTNRTLRQQVVFTGQLIPDGNTVTNALNIANAASPATQVLQLNQATQLRQSNLGLQNYQNQVLQQQLPLSNSRIQGVLKVGNQQVELNAVPAGR